MTKSFKLLHSTWQQVCNSPMKFWLIGGKIAMFQVKFAKQLKIKLFLRMQFWYLQYKQFPGSTTVVVTTKKWHSEHNTAQKTFQMYHISLCVCKQIGWLCLLVMTVFSPSPSVTLQGQNSSVYISIYHSPRGLHLRRTNVKQDVDMHRIQFNVQHA